MLVQVAFPELSAFPLKSIQVTLRMMPILLLDCVESARF